jgi:hypothetical protein
MFSVDSPCCFQLYLWAEKPSFFPVDFGIEGFKPRVPEDDAVFPKVRDKEWGLDALLSIVDV